MSNTNNIDAAPTTTAQLFWDDQDPRATGWCLRHTDKRGNEDAIAIDGDKIEGIATLAERCAEALSDYGRTTIKAFVAGEHNPARIVVDGGDGVSADLGRIAATRDERIAAIALGKRGARERCAEAIADAKAME